MFALKQTVDEDERAYLHEEYRCCGIIIRGREDEVVVSLFPTERAQQVRVPLFVDRTMPTRLSKKSVHVVLLQEVPPVLKLREEERFMRRSDASSTQDRQIPDEVLGLIESKDVLDPTKRYR